jgi:hypothetical protein
MASASGSLLDHSLALSLSRLMQEALSKAMFTCRPVNEVLQKLTSLQTSGPPGASMDDIDELHVRLDEGLERTMDLEAAVAELMDIKADKSALVKLGQALQDLWKAVQELQGPEGIRVPCGQDSPKLCEALQMHHKTGIRCCVMSLE